MIITFGHALDGTQSRTVHDSMGDLVCGPLRLIEILEMQLGLTRKSVSDAARCFQFVRVLKSLTRCRPRFYSNSFEKDQLSVAEVLLQWRDSLVLAGWNGATSGISRRLQDLADIHSALKDAAAPGQADRLAAIRDALAHRNHGVKAIIVVDPAASFPGLWQEVITKLGATFRIPEEGLSAISEGEGTDLQQLCAALTSTSPATVKWQNDGSIIHFSAYSEFTLAHMAAKLLGEKERSYTLIAESDCCALDEILIAANQPSLGVCPSSRARPIPQLLLLALRLYWKPLNPLHLLEFLTHTNGPVEFHLRNELSRALVECPGMGGPKWLAAIAAVKEIYKAKPSEEAKNLVPRLERDLAEWIDVSRYDARLGAPGSELANGCRRVAKWARKQSIYERDQGDISNAAHFQTLAAQAAELGEALAELDKVTQCQMERLIRRVTGNGWPSLKVRELGHCHRVGSPAACIEPADTVLWWSFSEPQKPLLPHWTSPEIQDLRSHGAEIPSAATILAAQSAQWLRPIFAARRKLMLFTPRQRQGEPVANHPLLSRIEAVMEGGLPTIDVDVALGQKGIPGGEKVGYTPLTVARRWWKLKDGRHLGNRSTESFSSADKFIYSPYAWVLEYKAALRPGVLSQFRMQSETVLRGNLLHRLLDMLGAGPIRNGTWAAITQEELSDFLERQWPMLLEQEGATLLLLGKQSEAAALLETGKQALWALAQQLRAAQVQETETNVHFKAEFIGGELDGYVDLLVKRENTRVSVVDLKAGRLEEKKRELQFNVPLQLAIYGFLHRQERGEWPSGAYFILNHSRMLAHSKDYFPLASAIPAKEGAGGLETCWNEFVEMWRYRRGLLDQGWVELTLGGTAPENGNAFPSPGPFEHWQPAKDQDKYNDFRALTGMEVNA